METENIEINGNDFLESLGVNSLENGQVGYILLGQLVKYNFSRLVNPSDVTREIISLDKSDGNSRTKKEAVFSSGKLKGFHHKHYFSARHIPINMHQHNIDGNTGEFKPAFDRVNKRIMQSDRTDDERAGRLANFLTIDAYQQRSVSRALTGDWIVYKKYEGKSYYLYITPHYHNTDKLYEKLKDWYYQLWPFLFAS
jgi:hypothetical protein